MMPEKFKKWVYYDIKKFKYVFIENTPDKIKKEFNKWIKDRSDFVLNNDIGTQ